MKKINLKRVLFSLSFLVVWMFTMLDISVSSQITTGIALFYTLIAPWAYKEITEDKGEDKWRYLFYVGPVIYLVSVLILVGVNMRFLVHPIPYAFLTFMIAMHLNFKKKVVQKLVFSVFLTLFYTFCLYPLFNPTM